MRYIRSFFSFKSMMSRILAFIYVDILILTIMLGLFSYTTARSLTIEDIGASQQQFVREVSNMVNQDIYELQSFIEVITYDKGLNEVLQGNLIHSIDERKYQVDKQIQVQVNSVIRSKGIIGAMVIINKGPGVLSYAGEIRKMSFRSDLEDAIRKESWFGDMMHEGIRMNWLGYNKVDIFYDSCDNKDYLTFSMPVSDVGRYPNFSFVGAVYVVLNQDFFSWKMNNLVSDSRRILYMCTDDGRLIASSGEMPEEKDFAAVFAAYRDENADHRGHFIYKDGQEEFLIAHFRNPQYQLNFLEMVPVSDITVKLSTVTATIIRIIILTTVFLFLLVFLEMKKVLKPLKSLYATISKIKKGNMAERVVYARQDEIGQLGRCFNEMMDRIGEAEREKAKCEFQALQAQINPHFLYNTLNTIRMMAISQNANDIRYAVTSLVKLFRFTFEKEGTFITVEEEIEVLNHYIQLQQSRYKNCFRARFDIREDVKKCHVIKLVLQPVVENAIFYGVGGSEGSGEITVEAFRRDEFLILRVRDNGKGMSPERAEEILRKRISSDAGFSSVGLYNINQRIKLYFGDPYGVFIESREKYGTSVMLKFPYGYAPNT